MCVSTNQPVSDLSRENRQQRGIADELFGFDAGNSSGDAFVAAGDPTLTTDPYGHNPLSGSVSAPGLEGEYHFTSSLPALPLEDPLAAPYDWNPPYSAGVNPQANTHSGQLDFEEYMNQISCYNWAEADHAYA